MTRTFANRFNRMYKVDYFKEPQAYNFGENLVKIPGLDGSLKMGKSEGNAIYLRDEPAVGVVRLTAEDVVRHELVLRIIRAYERYQNR